MITAWLASAALAATLVVGRDAPTVQAAIDAAEEGDVIVLPEGVWPGPARVDRPLTLTSDGGVLDGGGRGSVVVVTAPGARVVGLRARDSGQDLRARDACVLVEPGAVGAVVQGNELRGCTFGIWVHSTRDVRVVDNDIEGKPDAHFSRKGNGVHLFDSTGLTVQGNRVRLARDGVYVSAPHDSAIVGNTTSDLRYGIHYMYSFRNRIEWNESHGNITGIALMQSADLTVAGNVVRGNERHGILFRDALRCRIEGNVVEGNGEGLFFYSSLDNDIVGNRLAHNQIGARVWAGTKRNRVQGNAFVGNREQVHYVAAADQEWGAPEGGGNHWSDHLGWDQDGDGIGDRPYRVDAFQANLLHRHPSAVLLLNSPTLELLALLQAQMPVFRVPTVIDRWPLTRPEGAP